MFAARLFVVGALCAEGAQVVPVGVRNAVYGDLAKRADFEVNVFAPGAPRAAERRPPCRAAPCRRKRAGCGGSRGFPDGGQRPALPRPRLLPFRVVRGARPE
eukprot:2721927-Alexandrium_andersonii.AAC.1